MKSGLEQEGFDRRDGIDRASAICRETMTSDMNSVQVPELNVSAGIGTGGRRNRRGGRGGQSRQSVPTCLYEGSEPSLKGYVYDLQNEKNSDQFVKTTKEVISWVGREYTTYTGELCKAVETLTLVDPAQPTNPDTNDTLALEMWKLDVKEYANQVKVYKDFKARLYQIIIGQCTPALEDRLKSHSQWASIQQDGLGLLKVIKTITYTFEERRYLFDAVYEVKEEFYSMRQGKYESLQKYYERFKNQVEVMIEVGVTLTDKVLVDVVAVSN